MTPWSTKGFIAACIAGPVYLRKFRRLGEHRARSRRLVQQRRTGSHRASLGLNQRCACRVHLIVVPTEGDFILVENL